VKRSATIPALTRAQSAAKMLALRGRRVDLGIKPISLYKTRTPSMCQAESKRQYQLAMLNSARLPTKGNVMVETVIDRKGRFDIARACRVSGRNEKRKWKRERGLKACKTFRLISKKRLRVSKLARDPRKKACLSPKDSLTVTRSQSPIIGVDGLIRLSMLCPMLNATKS